MNTPSLLYVFDIDDTLTKTAQLHQVAFIHALQKMGVQQMDTNFGDYLHHTDSYIAKSIFEKDRQSTFTHLHLITLEQLLLEQISKEQINEVQGAKALLQRLENTPEAAFCFATGSLLAPALYKLSKMGVSKYEKLTVASNSYFEREQIVQAAIKKAEQCYQKKFDRIISFGDGIWDYKTAQNLGIDFVGIGLKNKQQLLQAGAAVVYESFMHYPIA